MNSRRTNRVVLCATLLAALCTVPAIQWAVQWLQPSFQLARPASLALVLTVSAAALGALCWAGWRWLGLDGSPPTALRRHELEGLNGGHSSGDRNGGNGARGAEEGETKAKPPRGTPIGEHSLLRILVDSLPDCFFIKDREGKYLLSNKANARLNNINLPEGLIGKTVFELFPEEIARRFDADDRKVITTNEAMVDREEPYRSFDGREGWFLTTKLPLRNSKGEAIGLMGVARDITELKKAAECLRASELRLRSVLDSMFAFVVLLTDAGDVLEVNRALLEAGGVNRNEVIGKPFAETFWITHSPAAQEKTRQALRIAAQGERTRDDFPLRVKEGIRIMDTTFGALRDEGGRVCQIIASGVDVTARKEAENALRQKHKMEALGTLAGGIAHDFNNILTAITGNSTLALADVTPDHPARESLEEIKSAAVRASDLVRRILAFSRQQEPVARVVPLGPIVEEVLKLLRASLPAMIEIRAELPSSLPLVRVDPTQIHQVIMNLSTNAAHAMREKGGGLQITLDEAPPASAEAESKRWVRLTVRDQGCGMDGKILDRIFEPFFTTKPPGEGSGLGLAVVHGIVQSHGGSITVQSRPGEGTTFQIFFPAALEQAGAAAADSAAPFAGQGQTILYVDDEESLVFLARRMLSRMGYQVVGATSAEQAIRLFMEDPKRFALVLTDMSMPGLSGIDLASELFRIEPATPIVMLTGYIRQEVAESAKRIGIREVLLKPNTVEEIGPLIEKILREGRAAPAAAKSAGARVPA